MPYADDVTEPRCPKCTGYMWDNRATKRNPKAPDWKCKDRNCDGAVWPEKAANGARPAVAAAQAKQAYTSGPAIAGLDDAETGAAPRASQMAGWDKLFNAYDVCVAHAITTARKLDAEKIGSSPESVAAIAATLLIQADRQGLTR